MLNETALREFERWDEEPESNADSSMVPSDKNMWHFTADLHLDHLNIARKRGFTTAEEHNQCIIDGWNKAVSPGDVVVILGDILWTVQNEHNKKIWNQLRGNKIVVKGNHDYWLKKAKIPYRRIYQRRVHGFYIVCCHYPLRVWNRKGYGAIHLHGHSHGAVPPIHNSMDVGVDVAKLVLGEYRPFNLKEIAYLTKGVK